MTTSFAEHYGQLVAKILSEEAEHDFNQRTKSSISFLPEGYSFWIDLSDNVLPTCGLRRTRPHIAAAETAWCFLGSTNVGWLNTHTRIWDQFADGNGDIMEAYGNRWRHAFGYDQIETAIERLKKDPSDRRIYISSWDPMFDLKDTSQKTVPCPVGFTLSTYNNKLNSSLLIRSSDVFIGLPLDVMRHALVMKAIANSLQMQPGHMRVTLAHPHLYENQWKMAEEMLDQEIKIPILKMPSWNIGHIIEKPDEYVKTIRDAVFAAPGWPDYDPKVQVTK